MNAEDFIEAYEGALATRQWSVVEPLMHDNVCVTFSNGGLHRGKGAVQAAFERNFRLIENESFRLTHVQWVMKTESFAVFVFEFGWTGQIEGRESSGQGRGTSALVRDGASWKLIAEHLGPSPRGG